MIEYPDVQIKYTSVLRGTVSLSEPTTFSLTRTSQASPGSVAT